MSEAIPSWVRIGGKVACIKGGTPTCVGVDLVGGYPVTGGIYVVTGFTLDRAGKYWLLKLAGFECEGDWGWDIRRFRPLVSQADDIATHFAHHLDTRAPERV